MESAARRIHASLAQLAAHGANVGQIADAAVATWRSIDAVLSPIIGQGGVAALYKRSLYLSRGDHPWLAVAAEDALQPDDFATLHRALAKQTSGNAAAANGALLTTFSDLLTSLIGASLTERLLQSVWDHTSSGHAVQENTP